jgi:hypothetical protein
MPLYPERIARCQHIKINGTQCGSPALRLEKYCFYHMRWFYRTMDIHGPVNEPARVTSPTLEDANSIQVGLAEMVRMLLDKQIDHKTAALVFYALQTAASNVRYTSFEPPPTHVVIDPECVEGCPIGATAWSAVEGCRFDEVQVNKTPEDKQSEREDAEKAYHERMRYMQEMEEIDPTYSSGPYEEVLKKVRKGMAERRLAEAMVPTQRRSTDPGYAGKGGS